jgi:hypothetical protein
MRLDTALARLCPLAQHVLLPVSSGVVPLLGELHAKAK